MSAENTPLAAVLAAVAIIGLGLYGYHTMAVEIDAEHQAAAQAQNRVLQLESASRPLIEECKKLDHAVNGGAK